MSPPLPRSVGSAPADPLLAACRAGDRTALEQVFRTHAPGLSRMLARMVGDADEAADLLQQTFVAAIGAFPRYRGDASVASWLAGIAVHAVHSHWRRPAVKRRVSLELVGEPASGAPSPDRALAARRKLARVHHHLAALSPSRRMAWILNVVEGRAVDEVAALMGAGRATTRSRIYWARRVLRQRMRKDAELAELLGDEP